MKHIKELQLENEKLKEENQSLKNMIKIEDGELERMRKELGRRGGAGHFWRNDKMIANGGERDAMREEEVRKVLKLLALGETKVNFKESEFLFSFEKRMKRNSQEV